MDLIGQRRLAAGQKLFPRHIKDEVLDALARARRGKGPRPQFVTAYQILSQLRPVTVQRNLATHYGSSGRRAGHYFGAASCVAHACLAIQKEDRRTGRQRIEISYLDTRGLKIGSGQTIPGYTVCGIYRRV
jgi:hypothetical protein